MGGRDLTRARTELIETPIVRLCVVGTASGVSEATHPKDIDRPQESEAQPFKMASDRKDVAIYAVGLFFARGVGVFMLPVDTRGLTPEDYGVRA